MLSVRFTKVIGFVVSMVMILSCLSFGCSENVQAMNTSLEYVRYDYNAKTTSTYTLDSVPYTDNSRILVPENRNEDLGNTAVVRLVMNDAYIGTGFIVGKNVIATDAHCISNQAAGTFIEKIDVIVCKDKVSEVIATYEPDSIHVPANYFNYAEEYKHSCYDYGLIYIGDASFDANDDEKLLKHGVFNLGVPMDKFLADRNTVYASGFPGQTHGDKDNIEAKRYVSEGNIQFFTKDINKFSSSFALRFAATSVVSGGQSGGPLYTYTKTYDGNSYRTAIGIVTGGGYNSEEGMYIGTYGVRVTTDILHFYLNNSYL